ncbi:MAG: hypothetical protein IJY71_01690 [Clostridia bacterium]|nr:hypothetical protein [Clostridia bacterium]
MKHIFVVNPKAGPTNSVAFIRQEVEKLRPRYDCEVYETTGVGDATDFVRRYLESNPNLSVRFYACGGDGTLNEVMTGALGHAGASISCYPCGSGNDFVKYYGGADRFMDFEALLNGKERGIDILTDGERYSINVANFGFDYAVAKKMSEVKNKLFFKGKTAYTFGVVHSLFHAMKSKAKVFVDGKRFGKEDALLLCTVSNGSFVGGSYNCAPLSDNEDGLLEICLVKPISVFRLLRLIGVYKKGQHLNNPKFADILYYVRGKEVEVFAEEDSFGYTMDGELVTAKHVVFRILPEAIRFAVPLSKEEAAAEADAEQAVLP